MVKNNDIHNLKILKIYSSIAYLFAYLAVYLSYNLITALVGRFYHIQTILFHNKLQFITKDYSHLWNFETAFFVFSSGTIVFTIIVLILLKVYNYYEKYEGIFKIFLFWIILHIINRIVGLLIIGTIFDLYFLNVLFDWLFVDYWVRNMFVIIVLFLIFVIGKRSTRPLLLSARSFKFVKQNTRIFFIEAQAFKAWCISSIIIFIFHLPSFSYAENLLSVSMFLLILPTYYNYKSIKFPVFEIESEDTKYKVPWSNIISILVFIVLFRVLLIKGISF
ncbi:MAG: hypothetical protein WCL51_07715 [Bacteroidota bacterium]